MRSHGALNVFYYTAMVRQKADTTAGHPTCCCCLQMAVPVRCQPFAARGPQLPLASPVLQTTLPGRAPDRQGKVRDLYEFADGLLIVATDRMSAFDYVLG